MQDFSEKWMVVVNSHAGSGRTMHLWEKARTLLLTRGIDFDWRETRHEGHATELAFNAAQQGYRRFVAVGGDGTVHEVLGGIMAYVEALGDDLSKYTLAVIPIGSGNDWIKTHNIPLDVEAAVDLIAAGSFSTQDVVRAVVLPESDSAFGNSSAVETSTSAVKGPGISCMANIGGIGYDARVCDVVNRWKKKGRHGRLLYIKSLIYNFFHYKYMNVAIECDGVMTYSGEVFSIAFGNGKYSGGGLPQTPEAVPNDGLLDVTIIPRYPKLRILREFPKLFAGKILSVDGIVARKARTVMVRPIAEDRELVEIDGEIIGPVPVLLTVCPGQIHVLHREV